MCELILALSIPVSCQMADYHAWIIAAQAKGTYWRQAKLLHPKYVEYSSAVQFSNSLINMQVTFGNLALECNKGFIIISHIFYTILIPVSGIL